MSALDLDTLLASRIGLPDITRIVAWVGEDTARRDLLLDKAPRLPCPPLARGPRLSISPFRLPSARQPFWRWGEALAPPAAPFRSP